MAMTGAMNLASILHDAWRAPRKLEGGDGTYGPRIKSTSDTAWISRHGVDVCDIANTDFVDLPADWQAENLAAAESALRIILIHHDLESASAALHEDWMQRNPKAAWNAAQHVPYAELPEDEKAKDRAIIRAACGPIYG
jgi:hypothetical protein